jgi:hypothetical protein
MKVVSTYLISLVVIISFSCCAAMQEQIMDIRIQLAPDKYRRNHVDAGELIKYKQFGMQDAEPFDTYFLVKSATYEDYIDGQECAGITRNLLEHLPCVIQKDAITKLKRQSLEKKKEEQERLKKRYLFPKFVSQSFINRVQQKQSTFILYKNGDKALSARYAIEGPEQKEKAEPYVLPQKVNESRREYAMPSLFNESDNFLNFAAVCAFVSFLAIL